MSWLVKKNYKTLKLNGWTGKEKYYPIRFTLEFGRVYGDLHFHFGFWYRKEWKDNPKDFRFAYLSLINYHKFF